MIINSNSAVIDNDFLSHAIEMKKSDDEVVEILSHIFYDLRVNPIMHPLVVKHEVLPNSTRINKIFSENIVGTPSFSDIHNNDTSKMAYYSILVLDLYKRLTGSTLDLGSETVYTFWRRNESLGEVHSLSTCLVCECGIFLSDDKDSQFLKNIIQEQYGKQIEVYNRQTVVDVLRDIGTTLSRKELRPFAHLNT